MAESTATRRARFSYLEQHQKKTSTLNEPAPTLQRNEATKEEEESVPQVIKSEKQQGASLRLSIQPSEKMSNTVATELNRKQLNPGKNKTKHVGSVSSVKLAPGTFPLKPKLDPGGTSFTCPYCFLVYPAKEAKEENEWR